MSCPLCSSNNIKQIYSGTDKVISKLFNYVCQLFLFKCCNCGMIFLDRINYDLGKIHELYWEMLTNNIKNGYSVDINKSQDLLLNCLDKYRETGNLLEIGCGDGAFLKLAQDQGWKVTGIEISTKAATLARDKYGLDILNDSFEQVFKELKRNFFDIVVMWGVIEHLHNPVMELRLVKLLLRKGGILLIYTPNANSIFHKLARAVYFLTCGFVKFPMERIVTAMHTIYFTPDTIIKILNNCNFTIQNIEMVNIDIDFIFEAYNNFWWSNKIFLSCAKFIQKVSYLNSMWYSHMIIFAESV